MGKSTGYLISIAMVIGIGAILQYFLCCANVGSTNSMNDTPISGQSVKAGMPFTLNSSDGNFSVSSESNFDFPKSTYSYLKPINSSLEEGIEQLRNYLAGHQDVSLGIKGYAFPNEENTSAFPTLGEARANAVKSALIDRGILGSQMTVSGEVFSGMMPEMDTVVLGPVSYLLTQTVETATNDGESDPDISSETKEDLAAFVSDLKLKPMVLHFETGSAYVNLTPNERQLISQLNQYIDQNSEAQIVVTGHADNSGNPETNLRLGKERAEFLKSYLVRNGFQANRITTISRGESEPVASNDTATGKAENRRVVLTIEN